MPAQPRLLALLILAATPALTRAADLVAPWSPGFSDLELHVQGGEGRDPSAICIVGFGLGAGVSLGFSIAGSEAEDREAGIVALVSRSVSDRAQVVVWLELGHPLRSRDAELSGATVTAGTEVSLDYRGATPYARLEAVRYDGMVAWHSLLGLMVPLAGGLELHVEISSEQPERGPWPIHVAAGPNLGIADGIELLPELSYLLDRAEDRGAWALGFGVIVDPHSAFR